MITVTCPSCHRSTQLPNGWAGKRRLCPKCNEPIRVPARVSLLSAVILIPVAVFVWSFVAAFGALVLDAAKSHTGPVVILAIFHCLFGFAAVITFFISAVRWAGGEGSEARRFRAGTVAAVIALSVWSGALKVIASAHYDCHLREKYKMEPSFLRENGIYS